MTQEASSSASSAAARTAYTGTGLLDAPAAPAAPAPAAAAVAAMPVGRRAGAGLSLCLLWLPPDLLPNTGLWGAFAAFDPPQPGSKPLRRWLAGPGAGSEPASVSVIMLCSELKLCAVLPTWVATEQTSSPSLAAATPLSSDLGGRGLLPLLRCDMSMSSCCWWRAGESSASSRLVAELGVRGALLSAWLVSPSPPQVRQRMRPARRPWVGGLLGEACVFGASSGRCVEAGRSSASGVAGAAAAPLGAAVGAGAGACHASNSDGVM